MPSWVKDTITVYAILLVAVVVGAVISAIVGWYGKVVGYSALLVVALVGVPAFFYVMTR